MSFQRDKSPGSISDQGFALSGGLKEGAASERICTDAMRSGWFDADAVCLGLRFSFFWMRRDSEIGADEFMEVAAGRDETKCL